MAAKYSLYCKKQAFERAVLAQGLNGIFRAGRCETAGRRFQRGDAELIEADQQDKGGNRYFAEDGADTIG